MPVDGPFDWSKTGRLFYSSDREPGVLRRGAGNGFYYVTSEGGRVDDEEILARVRSLVIPPAWTDVWICAKANGHIQVTGRDERKRKQYRYHPSWTERRDDAKFGSLTDFASALPALRDRVDSGLRKRNLDRDRVLASVVWLLDNSLIRVGNDRYSRDNKSYGLTTLRMQHVNIEGSRIRFAFRGKSGKEWKLKLEDRRIASTVARIAELPGQNLFQFIDEDGKRRPVQSNDVNDYIRDAIGDFTSKHFRTWGATVGAASALYDMPDAGSTRERTRLLNQALDEVSAKLRNTRAVCRKCYVHPAIIEKWEASTLCDELRDIRRRNSRPLKGLDHKESTVLRWLRENEV